MFREMAIKIVVFFFAYIPDKIKYLGVGRIKFIFITIEVIRVCNQLCFKDNLLKSNCILTFICICR